MTLPGLSSSVSATLINLSLSSSWDFPFITGAFKISIWLKQIVTRYICLIAEPGLVVGVSQIQKRKTLSLMVGNSTFSTKLVTFNCSSSHFFSNSRQEFKNTFCDPTFNGCLMVVFGSKGAIDVCIKNPSHNTKFC